VPEARRDGAIAERLICVLGLAVKDWLADMLIPSLDPGGVSSAADAEADAEVEAVPRLCAYLLPPGVAVAVDMDGAEAAGPIGILVDELAWCLGLELRTGIAFIVIGMLALDDPGRSSSGLFGVDILPLRVEWLAGSKLAELSSCSTNSSHLTLRLEDGRSARSARFKQSAVRW